MIFNCPQCGNTIGYDQYCGCYTKVEFNIGDSRFTYKHSDDIMWVIRYRNGNIKKISFPIRKMEE